jgi:hypothetical protein
MSRVRLLDGVDREGPDRVDAELIQGFAHRAQVVLPRDLPSSRSEESGLDLITLARSAGIWGEDGFPALLARISDEE